MNFQPITPSISLEKLQITFNYVFRKNFNNSNPKQTFMAYTLIKDSEKIAHTIFFYSDKLNWNCLFGFLIDESKENEDISNNIFQQQIQYQGLLVLLQEVVTKLIKLNQPLVAFLQIIYQTLQIILNKSQIIQSLINHKYQKSVAKILSIIVITFWENKINQALAKQFIEKFDSIVDQIFYQLISIPSISKHSQLKNSLRSFQQESLLNCHQKQDKNLSIKKAYSYLKSVWNYQDFLKQFIINELKPGQARSLKMYQQLFSKLNIHDTISNLANQKQMKQEEQRVKFQKKHQITNVIIFLNDLLMEHFNVKTYCFQPQICNQKWEDIDQSDYQEYCQGIISVIIAWLRLCQKYLENQRKTKDSSNNLTSKGFIQYKLFSHSAQKPVKDIQHTYNQKNNQLDYIQQNFDDTLETCYRIIQSSLNTLPVLQNILMIPLSKQLQISSGQIIKTIGLFRYKVLQLFTGIFQVLVLADYKYTEEHYNNPRNSKKFRLNVPKEVNPFMIIQQYLKNQKWNNIIQSQLIRLEQAVLAEDNCQHFFQNAYLAKKGNISNKIIDVERLSAVYVPQNSRKYLNIGFDQSPPKLKKQSHSTYSNQNQHQKFFHNQSITLASTLLGTLISQFRNPSFVFLSTMNFTPNGNIYTIYKMVKNLTKKCRKQDQRLINKNFQHWQKFVDQDIVQYQNKISKGQFFYGGTDGTGPVQISYQNSGQVLQSLQQVFQFHEGKYFNEIPAGKSRSAINKWSKNRKSSVDLREQLRGKQRRTSLIEKSKERQKDLISRKRRRKESLTRDSFINQLEGLRHQ